MTETRIRRRPRALLPVIALAALVAAGCSDDPTGPKPVDETVFADALGIDLVQFRVTESGLYIRDVVVGEGAEAVPGTRAFTEIEGWLPNGSVFQPRTDFDFELGTNAVIAGFEEGVRGMRVGGTRVLILPAELAYGDDVLVFEVSLLDVQ